MFCKRQMLFLTMLGSCMLVAVPALFHPKENLHNGVLISIFLIQPYKLRITLLNSTVYDRLEILSPIFAK